MMVRMAHAKLNLFLRVERRRDDGYHDIETLFQRIALADRLTFERAAEGLELECLGRPVDCPRDANLIARAYHALVGRCGPRPCGARVVLEKRIPVGGGLGGGSADAAAALRGFNELFALDMSAAALRAVAAELGADAPFFLGPPTAIGRGRGDVLSPVAPPSAFWAALAFPAFPVSTAEVYARYDPKAERAAAASDLASLVAALARGDLARALDLMFNEMESLAFGVVPALGDLRRRLEGSAQRPVRVSGSGSTLFTLAETQAAAQAIASAWRERESVETDVARFVVE